MRHVKIALLVQHVRPVVVRWSDSEFFDQKANYILESDSASRDMDRLRIWGAGRKVEMRCLDSASRLWVPVPSNDLLSAHFWADLVYLVDVVASAHAKLPIVVRNRLQTHDEVEVEFHVTVGQPDGYAARERDNRSDSWASCDETLCEC